MKHNYNKYIGIDKSKMNVKLKCNLFIVGLSICSINANATPNHPVSFLDKRQVSSGSAKQFNAIGRLGFNRQGKSKRSMQYIKINCTANLVSLKRSSKSNLVVTAEHCLSNKVDKYVWSSLKNNGGKIKRNAKIVHRDDEFDWAILKLNRSVPEADIEPILLNENNINNIQLNDKSTSIMVAGFSMDELGDYGQKLTYDLDPLLIGVDKEKEDTHIGKVQSVIYQGDSGGPLIYRSNGLNYLLGIISYIEKDANLLKTAKGKFGNTQGYFVNLVGYKNFFRIFRLLSS